MKTFFETSGLRYCMIGSGSWATALVKLLLNNQSYINWYLRSDENIEKIKEWHHNPNYLTTIHFAVCFAVGLPVGKTEV